jgi:hypothetical protein
MTTKTYTNRSNCVRAAKVVLGKDAKPGVDFTVDGSGKEWTWTAVTAAAAVTGAPEETAATETEPVVETAPVKAPKAKRQRGAKGTRRITEQPKMKFLLNCIKETGEAGITVPELAKLGNMQPHSVRGAISRCIKDGAPVEPFRFEKKNRYRSIAA